MAPSVPTAFARARDLVTPAMRETIERLAPGIRRVVVYHLGWENADGRPGDADGGKAVRPALALVSAEAVGAEAERAVPGGVAVELVHNFSLLHDDVMDGDTERRHRPTAWKLFGIGEAILAGDALHALAQELLIDPPEPERLRAAAALSEATAAMITGQSEDLSFESRADVTIEECLDMLAHKTAALMSCACKIGAILGDADDRSISSLGDFGRQVGLAYQAVDDVLGIWGKPEATGKPAWSDLRQRKKTLPVVSALAAGGPAADRLAALLAGDLANEEDVALAAKLVEENGCRERAMEEASRRLASALGCLDRIEAPAAARKDLEEIAGFITSREF